MAISRRGFLRGLGAVFAAIPAAKVLPLLPAAPAAVPTMAPVTSYSTYLVGKDAYVIGQYADYVSFSAIALSDSVTPQLDHLSKEMGYRLAHTLNAQVDPPPRLPKIRAGAFV